MVTRIRLIRTLGITYIRYVPGAGSDGMNRANCNDASAEGRSTLVWLPSRATPTGSERVRKYQLASPRFQ
jgi:hypothetical protein